MPGTDAVALSWVAESTVPYMILAGVVPGDHRCSLGDGQCDGLSDGGVIGGVGWGKGNRQSVSPSRWNVTKLRECKQVCQGRRQLR